MRRKRLTEEDLKEDAPGTLTLRVFLNGTDRNPWEVYGLLRNPFPQLGISEFDAFVMQLQGLGGVPIKDRRDIRRRLKGWNESFIKLLQREFKPGEYVTFQVTFPDPRLYPNGLPAEAREVGK